MIIWAKPAQHNKMRPDNSIIASGNLATKRRTIMGVLGQCALLEISRGTMRRIFAGAGLPDRALEEPDFPISLDQELVVCMALVHTLGDIQSPALRLFNAREKMGIDNLGVLGMAMRHAANAIDALKICLTYPQLTWGHSRMVVRRKPDATLFSFTMERPTLRGISGDDTDKLVQYCLVLDLLTSLHNINDIVESGQHPLYITFPFPQPHDWSQLTREPPCPVHFQASEASLAYPAAMDDKPLPRTNPLLYRSYESIAKQLSHMLGEELSLTERVTRWLWAYTPPPKRGEIANLLSMSERNMTRKLGNEGTSYTQLLAQVQEKRAKNFLRSPGLSIAEISDRLGYAEPAAFSRAFNNWTGASPLKWRQGS